MAQENADDWPLVRYSLDDEDTLFSIPASDGNRFLESDRYLEEEEIEAQESDNYVIVEVSSSEEDTIFRFDPDNRIITAEEDDSSDTIISPYESVRSDWAMDEENPAPNLNSVITIERESDIIHGPSVVSTPENPNTGVENPIIRLENPDYEPEIMVEGEVSRSSSKRSYGAMASEDDDGQTCPICLEPWTNAGKHRLCALKCGHTFGKSCISRWLSGEKKKHCPQCHRRAVASDIYDLYVTKLIALDANEKTRLEKELEELKEQKKKLQKDLIISNLNLESCREQLEVLKAKIAKLEGTAKNGNCLVGHTSETGISIKVKKFHLEKTIGIQEGSCRVSAYSSLSNILVISHQIRNQLFWGYGIKKITKIGSEYNISPSLYLHKKPLRDLSFHPTIPNLVLSVSFDMTAKLSDVETRTLVRTFKMRHQLWSCCWDHDENNVFYIGTGNGVVSVYDIRIQDGPIACLNPIDDCGAVVALRYAPAKLPFKGALICCRLNSIVLYEKVSPTEYNAIPVSSLVGPFFSLSYNSDTQHLLASCRPSVENPKVRHIYCELNGTTLNQIFSFNGGTRQTLLCRSCFLPVNNETLVAAFQENANTIELWSTTTGSRFQSIPVGDQILDLISIRAEGKNLLGSVSESAFRFFEESV